MLVVMPSSRGHVFWLTLEPCPPCLPPLRVWGVRRGLAVALSRMSNALLPMAGPRGTSGVGAECDAATAHRVFLGSVFRGGGLRSSSSRDLSLSLNAA
jgi:hypothetical protein